MLYELQHLRRVVELDPRRCVLDQNEENEDSSMILQYKVKIFY